MSACSVTVATERYHTCRSVKPGRVDSHSAGSTKVNRREPELSERGPGVAERLKEPRAGEDEPGGDEIQRNDAQIQGADCDHVRLLRKDAHKELRAPLTQQRHEQHQEAAQECGLLERLAHALKVTRPIVLARDRGRPEGERHHRQEQRLHHPPADAKAGLGWGSEAADRPVNGRQDHEHHEEFPTRGQADVEDAAQDSRRGRHRRESSPT